MEKFAEVNVVNVPLVPLVRAMVMVVLTPAAPGSRPPRANWPLRLVEVEVSVKLCVRVTGVVFEVVPSQKWVPPVLPLLPPL